jgi:glycosyltransferase involved in cell wall biosynthesis
MRIVYIADTRAVGGAERYLVTLAEETARSGHEVLLLAPQESFVAWLTREAPSTRVMCAFSDAYQDAHGQIRRGAALLRLLYDVARSLRRIEPAVVHINNGGYPGSDLCRIALPAARLAGVRCRVMTVNSNPWPRDRLADARVQAVADRLVLSSANAVISPSKAVAQGLQARRGMRSNIGHLIHYGVPPVPLRPHAAAGLRRRLAPAGELLVGMVSARPVTAKGYGVFAEALARAGERVRGALVGPPPRELLAKVDSGQLPRLALEGPHQDVGDYYAAFDVLVVPSTAEECMPLVILEAASVGTPTFGSRLAGIPDAITDGVEGALFEPGSAEELAELIQAAERDRERTAAMGSAARERWLREFDLDTMVRATLTLYHECALTRTQNVEVGRSASLP